MTAPDPRDAEIAALHEEIAELRARLAALEDFVGIHGSEAAAAPPDEPASDENPYTSIEPSAPWGLKPPGGGGEP